jgi:Cu/Ag efflux pump CusA
LVRTEAAQGAECRVNGIVLSSALLLLLVGMRGLYSIALGGEFIPELDEGDFATNVSPFAKGAT